MGILIPLWSNGFYCVWGDGRSKLEVFEQCEGLGR